MHPFSSPISRRMSRHRHRQRQHTICCDVNVFAGGRFNDSFIAYQIHVCLVTVPKANGIRIVVVCVWDISFMVSTFADRFAYHHHHHPNAPPAHQHESTERFKSVSNITERYFQSELPCRSSHICCR